MKQNYEIRIQNQIKYNDQSILLEGIYSTYGKIMSNPFNYEYDSKSLFIVKSDGKLKHIRLNDNLILFDKNDNIGIEIQYLFSLFSITLGLLRKISPKFGENIILYGFTIQNFAIYDLFTKSGCFVYIISTEMDIEHIKNKISEKNPKAILDNIDHFFKREKILDYIIFHSKNTNNNYYMKEIQKFEEKICKICIAKGLTELYSLCDLDVDSLIYDASMPGQLDKSYNFHGIEYPYPYIRWDLKENYKLILQILIITLIYFSGFNIQLLTNPFGKTIILGYFSYPVTILWFLLVVNAFNLIDGLDGLASGIALIVATVLFSPPPLFIGFSSL